MRSRLSKKRLKLTQLDEDSKVSQRPTTSGGSLAIVAIAPPSQFGKAVWDELVKQGKLKKAGQGMYELAEWRDIIGSNGTRPFYPLLQGMPLVISH